MTDKLDQWLCVIPARLGSTRLKEKALADLGGKPLVVRVYERTAPLRTLGAEVVVATDDERIIAACKAHHVPAVMTSVSHQSGSDRCFEVASKSQRPWVLNIQGDEPFFEVADLLKLTELMMRRPFVGMGTLAVAMSDETLFQDPNIVKVVVSEDQRALYFSRAPIPYHKGHGGGTASRVSFHAHVGIYAFRREALGDFIRFPKSKLESCESLEQLRALENGMEIIVEIAAKMPLNINTEEDLRQASEVFSRLK